MISNVYELFESSFAALESFMSVSAVFELFESLNVLNARTSPKIAPAMTVGIEIVLITFKIGWDTNFLKLFKISATLLLPFSSINSFSISPLH